MLSSVNLGSAWSSAAASLAAAQISFAEAAESALSGDIIDDALGMRASQVQMEACAILLRSLDDMSGQFLDILA